MNSGLRAACAVMAIASGIAAPFAGGHVGATPRAAEHRTSVKLSSKFPAFSGRVSSGFQRCVSHRRVELYRKGNGGEPKRLGRDRSKSSGHWEVRVDNVKSGAYYALAKPRSVGSGSKRSICKAGRSPVVVVD
jgi:hypothetical protein